MLSGCRSIFRIIAFKPKVKKNKPKNVYYARERTDGDPYGLL